MNPREELVERMVDGKRKDDDAAMGKFLRDQWSIELDVSYLVLIRGIKNGCIDKKWSERFEQCTLGQKIRFFQLCAKKESEKELVKRLQKYNATRNGIVHILNNLRTRQENRSVNALVEEAIALGREIMEDLSKIVPPVLPTHLQ